MTDKTEGLEVVAWMRRDGMKAMPADEKVGWEQSPRHSDVAEDYTVPLVYLTSAQVAVAAERSRIIAANAPEIERVNKHLTALETLIKKVHTAKGRYHTQLAVCQLYDLCGLPNVKPESKGKAIV